MLPASVLRLYEKLHFSPWAGDQLMRRLKHLAKTKSPRKKSGTIGMAKAKTRTPGWTWAWPVVAWIVLLATPFSGDGGLIAAVSGAALIPTVFAAVYHAEVVAHRTGEPFGTLVLA